MLDQILKYSKWIYIGCFIIDMLLCLYLLKIAPNDGGSMAAFAIIAIFVFVFISFGLQALAMIIGLLCIRHKSATIVLIPINILLLLYSFYNAFIGVL